MTDDRRWHVTAAGVAPVLAGVVLLVVGAFTGRVDVALLAAVPLFAGARDLAARPAGPVRLSFGAGDRPGDDGTVRATLEVEAPAGAPAALVGLHRDGRRGPEALLAVHGGRRVPIVVRTVRTGPIEVATAEAQGVGPGAASVSVAVEPVRRGTVVLPNAAPLRELPLPARLRGLTGAHDSRRPGEGGDLRDVHAFVPGDRLRRIDWRVTARRSPDLADVYVRGEHALAEAVVLLVVDSRDDVGPDPDSWAGSAASTRPDDPTSLDVARRAAASVAQAFLRAGDRVGLDDLGVLRRPLPPGGGRGQLDRIRHALALTRPEGRARRRVRSPRLPSGALAVVFSTFLDDEAAQAAATWRQIGHRVVAVDVMPPLRLAHLGGRSSVASRAVLVDREDRLAGLRERGVEVVTWRDDPAVALAALARLDRRRPGAGVPR